MDDFKLLELQQAQIVERMQEEGLSLTDLLPAERAILKRYLAI